MAEINQNTCCACSVAPKLIFACSGAADVGHISDSAARKLTAEGAGNMFCLAGIGGHVTGIVATTRAAAAILAIDGCPLDCARKALEASEFHQFQHLRLSDMGMEKGQSPVTDERIEQVVSRGRTLLAAGSSV